MVFFFLFVFLVKNYGSLAGLWRKKPCYYCENSSKAAFTPYWTRNKLLNIRTSPIFQLSSDFSLFYSAKYRICTDNGIKKYYTVISSNVWEIKWRFLSLFLFYLTRLRDSNAWPSVQLVFCKIYRCRIEKVKKRFFR